MDSVISKKFNKLSFDSSHKVTSEKTLVDDFIKSCNGVYDIFLGESENIYSYPYKGVVYNQKIYDPITQALKFVYCGVSSDTEEEKLLKRPMKDWYNPKLTYAGKKVEDLRKNLFLGKYYCKTEIVHVIYGKDHDEVQRGLNILEVYHISEIPEEQKLNTAKGGGNYTRGRRIASPVFKNENYIPIEEEVRNETSYWIINKKDLINFKYNKKYFYILPYDSNNFFKTEEIKYKNLTDHGKKMVEDNYLTGTMKDEKQEEYTCFIIDTKRKEELEGIAKLDMRVWCDDRKVACVHIVHDKEGYIDFSKSSGYETIKDCFEDSCESCYSTLRNYVKYGCYGYNRFDNFIIKYLGLNFNI